MIKEFIKDLNQLCKDYKLIYKIIEKLELDLDKSAACLYYKLWESNIKYISEKYSTPTNKKEHIEDSIFWYVFENDMGKNNYEAETANKEIKVKNASDLYRVIYDK